MANNIQITDANAVIQTVSTTQTGGVHVPHQIIDSGVISVSNFPSTQTVTGSVAINNFPTLQSVVGNKTNNNAIPGASNVGVLAAVCNAAPPTYTDTFQAALSVDTTGNLRVAATVVGGSDVQYATGAAVPTPTGTAALGWDGTNVRVLSTDATGQLKVLVENTVPVTGTFFQATQPVSGTVTANQGTSPWVVSLTSTTITGTVAVTESGTWTVNVKGNAGAIFDGATGSAVPANVLFEGGRAATANPTAVTDGQLVGVMRDKVGRAVVVQGHIRDLVGQQQTAISGVTTETTIISSISGVFADITQLIITTNNAAAATLTLRDSTGGTTRAVFDYPNAAVAPGSPLVVSFNPPLPQSTVNNNWTLQASANAGHYEVTAVYVKNI